MNNKDLGTVITPPLTAKYIISRLGQINEDQKILDPCVGSGVFIEELLEVGVNKNQIFSYDINPSYKDDIEKLGVSFQTYDTLLSLYPDSYNEFDIIVGNPPYLNKASEYVRKNKLKLRKIYGKINAHETYSMFIVNSIWRLKIGGKLGFITSDSFLTLSTHRKLRKFILDNCIINELLLAPKYLFSNQKVSTKPVILILTKYPGIKFKKSRQENRMRIIPRLNNEQEYLKPKNVREIKQIKYNSLPFKIFFIDVEDQIIELFEKAPRLMNFAKGSIGMHTHDNRKYIAAIENTKLADIFRKRNKPIINQENKYNVISKEDIKSGNWKPYLKRGGSDQYFRPIMEALAWDDDSIS
ncbi:MAG: class I SAM-dependent DNA methyltransferase, partial [Candidatus Hodarchaeota archaeon]